jgi:hypothetical protein
MNVVLSNEKGCEFMWHVVRNQYLLTLVNTIIKNGATLSMVPCLLLASWIIYIFPLFGPCNTKFDACTTHYCVVGSALMYNMYCETLTFICANFPNLGGLLLNDYAWSFQFWKSQVPNFLSYSCSRSEGEELKIS